MPLPIVSPTLFNGHGLGATVDEPHARAGNHIRVNSHPLLGLPVAPFVVWRGMSDTDRALALRSDVRFRDGAGRTVTAPFSLTPDKPVTATLALGPNEHCIWARAIADPIGSPGEGGGEPADPPAPIDPGSLDPFGPVFGGVREGRLRVAAAGLGGGMLAEAFVASAHGPASIGRRNEPPFTFSGPGIVEIRLSGHAAVVGVEWLEARQTPHVSFEPWAVLNLPHDGGPRYASIENAVKVSVERVNRQAPKRRPLQETLGATPPPAAPLADAAFERARVESLFKPLMPDLDSLINDLSASPFAQRVAEPVADATGNVVGEVDMSRLDRVFQGQFDPGVASFLGYKGYDEQFVEVENRILFYRIDGYFRDFPPLPIIGPSPVPGSDEQAFDSLLAALGAGHRFADAETLKQRLIRDIERVPNVELNKQRLTELEDHDDYIGLGALVVVDRRAPLLPLLPPAIDGHAHVGWLPSVVPPAARRETRVDVSGVVTGGLLAGEKRDDAPPGSPAVHLNKANAEGFHLPLVLGTNVDDETLEPITAPGTGFVADRDGAPVPIRYFVAQQDRFGRWSGWNSALNPPGPRPLPPRPVLEAYYTQPADPASAPGTVRVRVAIPENAALAPGAFALASLELDAEERDLDGNPLGPVVGHPQSAPPAAPGPLDFDFAGPVLAPTERRKLRLVARWVDTAAQRSVDSEPVTLTLTDPRPPAQPTPPDKLLYSGRPDVTGLAIVEHAWTPLAGQASFGVYYSDENRLNAHLRAGADANPGGPESGLLAALAGAADAAARATLLRANAALFPGHLFERLDGVVDDAPDGKKRFRHAVSASLRVLNLYRISAESESNARVDLATLPLVVFGVPNADPPAQPTLTVTPADIPGNDGPYAVSIEIAHLAQSTSAETFRLRRSSLGAAEALRMPVVREGAMGAVDDDGRQLAVTDDAGPVQIADDATLKPWVRYHWVAELRGAPAPGSGVIEPGADPDAPENRPVRGLWSRPSEPVSLILIPPEAPAAATALAASGTALADGGFTAVTLAFEHPHGLSGGAVGSYRARVERRLPDALMRALAEIEIAGEGPYAISGDDPGAPGVSVPSGTAYRLVLIDPLGRESVGVEAVLS